MFKKTLRWLGLGLLVLIGVQAYNTWKYATEGAVIPQLELPAVDEASIAQHLGQAIRIKTISTHRGMTERGPEFQQFIDWLAVTYPAANAAMNREIIGGLTPLYRWQGSDDSLQPVLITGHYDVVPVAETGLADWQQLPFSGAIADGFIWGRGALDDKSAVVAIMEAAEALAASEFSPKRTIYLSFGHDEEIGGREGAAAVAAHFKANNIQAAWSLDEGSMILKDVISGLNVPVASINVAEKGYVTLDITARANGGHSALPPRETAVSALANALTKLQSEPVPGGLTGASKDFFDGLGPHFSLEKRVLFANQWFYRPILERILSSSAATDAMLRSSKAPTMLQGSTKENVLPQVAVASVNFRIHPRDTVETLIEHAIDLIDDERIEITIRGGASSQPSAVSSTDSVGFLTLSKTFQQVFGELAIVPGLTIAGTDSKHYSTISDDSYRINPFVFTNDDIPRLHGKNERISTKGMAQAVQFYRQLIENSAN
ncbi:MAG: carboxypeptidase PM20D1 [Paracoccaceae bacterium]|jgi:carboxypeptidase PM20D1